MPSTAVTDSVRATMQDIHTSPVQADLSTWGLTPAQQRAADQVDAAKDAERAENAQGMNQGMTMLSLLVAGVLVYGALGFVGDHFLHTSFLLPVGIVLGAGLGIFMIIRRVSAQAVEYGVPPAATRGPSTGVDPDTDGDPVAPCAPSLDREDR